jgi:alkaline phosphatase D
MALRFSRRALLGAGAAALLVPACTTRAQPDSAFATGFTHGVASGDPRATSVILWTRYAAAATEPVRLRAEIASDPDFRSLIATGEAIAAPETDWCARVTATDLPANSWLYYRFASPGGERSIAGRTRTLPLGRTDHFRIAVVGCSNGTSGWFNAYAHAAARDDLDLAVHTGDYIYESPVTRSDAAPGLAALRHLAPNGEAIALADYRQRYASYRLDADLAALHRRLPMISVWDDHETANNSWRGGAAAHNPATEGSWNARVAAGMRAYHEWLPMGAPWWDSYQIGDLATLFRLETRLAGRDLQLDDQLDAILSGGGDMRANLSAFRDGPLADPNRSMMGADQESWLADGLASSVNAGARWQILAQQVVMGHTLFPAASQAWFAPGYQMTADDQAHLANRALMTELGVPFSMDKWDGYPAARERLYAAARAAKANLVTLSGDSHNAWSFDLGGPDRVGVEFAGQSVSSFGYERRFGGDPLRIASDFSATNPDLKWMDASQRGYMVLDITRDRIETEYVFVPAKDGRSAVSTGSRKLVAEHGARRLSV